MQAAGRRRLTPAPCFHEKNMDVEETKSEIEQSDAHFRCLVFRAMIVRALLTSTTRAFLRVRVSNSLLTIFAVHRKPKKLSWSSPPVLSHNPAIRNINLIKPPYCLPLSPLSPCPMGMGPNFIFSKLFLLLLLLIDQPFTHMHTSHRMATS
jgi:hypothetical protein